MSAVAAPIPASPPRKAGVWRFVKRNPTLTAGAVILVFMALVAVFAPMIAGDPLRIQPALRLGRPRSSSGSAPTGWGATSSPARSTARGSR